MDTAPIDSYDGAADIFTFGGGSFGMWLFLILAFLVFAGMIVRMAVHEGHTFRSVTEEDPAATATPNEPISEAA